MSDDDDITSVRLKIEGFVQSVGFRQFVIAEASRLVIDGWVRNRFDGTVEVLASGPTKLVEELVGMCMRGPMGARISDVEIHKAEPPTEKGFRRRPSY